MHLFRHFLALAAITAASLTGTAFAQADDEDMESINTAFAAILASMPRDGDLIMMPYVSTFGTRGEVEKELIDDEDVPGHKALRITATKGQNNWDKVVQAPIGPEIKKGDLLVMAYYLRVEEGSGEMPYNVIQMNDAPYTALIAGSETVTGEWDIYIASGKADKDYGQNKVGMQMHLANADHTIDVGPVFILNLGHK